MVRQKPVSPFSQFRQNPQAMLKGKANALADLDANDGVADLDDLSEVLVAKDLPLSTLVRPSYMWRSEPQMFVLVIRTRASVGRSSFGSGTCSTRTFLGPP